MDLSNLNKDRKARRKPTLDMGNMVFGKVPPQSKDLEEGSERRRHGVPLVTVGRISNI